MSEFSSSDQYEVLQTFPIVKNLSFHCFQRFLDRTKPRRSETEQGPVIFDLYNPSSIISEGMSLGEKRAWSHRTSNSWTSSFC